MCVWFNFFHVLQFYFQYSVSVVLTALKGEYTVYVYSVTLRVTISVASMKLQ